MTTYIKINEELLSKHSEEEKAKTYDIARDLIVVRKKEKEIVQRYPNTNIAQLLETIKQWAEQGEIQLIQDDEINERIICTNIIDLEQ